jgi:dTDP-4-amino-4,6-dideoxygalactose transaminase
MTEMQAALGLSQMKRLKSFIVKRHDIKEKYKNILKYLPITLPHQDTNGYSALHLYPICVTNAECRKEIFTYLRTHGIAVNVHYIPIHLQPYYRKMGFKQGDFPIAEDYYSKAISLPMYPNLTDEQLEMIKNTLKKASENVMIHE